MLGLLGLGAGIVPSMMAFDALQGQIPGIMPSILGNSLFGQVNRLINPPNNALNMLASSNNPLSGLLQASPAQSLGMNRFYGGIL